MSLTVDGVTYAMGMLPETEDRLGAFPMFGEAFAIIPKSQWQEVDNSASFGEDWIEFQRQFNSCVGNGAAVGLSKAIFLQTGKRVRLSPGFLYSLINGGRDNGAYVSDALSRLMDTGTCLFETVGQTPFYTRQIPPHAVKEASRFKVLEAYRVDPRQNVFDQLATGLQLDFIPVFGVKVTDAWYRLDDEGVSGWAQDDPRNERDMPNHCVHGDSLVKSAKYGWKIRTPGSWDVTFGIKGVSFTVDQHFRNRNDAFLIRAAKIDPNNAPPPMA